MGIIQREVLKFRSALKGESRGQLGPLGLVLPLVLIFGMAVVAIIIMSTVSAKTYTSARQSLDVADYNAAVAGRSQTLIGNDINASVENSFETFNQATQNLPLLAIIAVAFVVLAAIARFMVFTGGNAGGSAL